MWFLTWLLIVVGVFLRTSSAETANYTVRWTAPPGSIFLNGSFCAVVIEALLSRDSGTRPFKCGKLSIREVPAPYLFGMVSIDLHQDSVCVPQ
jgi:hypothetical protein